MKIALGLGDAQCCLVLAQEAEDLVVEPRLMAEFEGRAALGWQEREEITQPRDVLLQVPFVSTAGWGYLRLRLPDYADADLKTWLKRVQEQGWKDAFVFFKHEDEGMGPKLAKRFLELAA